MIKIDKAPIAEAPADFIRLGARRKQIDCDLFDSCPADCLSGVQPFPTVKEYIYRINGVKDKLNESHHWKCCYCETKFRYKGYLHIEHYRPKRLITRPGGNIPLGYFWLAYDWDNLLLSCGECNSTYKGNLFPLEQEATRAQPGTRNILNENPILLNPAIDDPRKHIKFVNGTPKGVTIRGRRTIQIFNLRLRLREDALELIDRLDSYLKDINMAAAFDEHFRMLPANIQRQPVTTNLLAEHQQKKLRGILRLEAALQPTAPFSAMARDYLSNKFTS